MGLLLATMLFPLVTGQYNPAWGPSPCPNGRCVPKWTPTYNSEPPRPRLQADPGLCWLTDRTPPAACPLARCAVSKSTIFMPCNYSGNYDPAVAAKFGIVDFGEPATTHSAAPLASACCVTALTPPARN